MKNKQSFIDAIFLAIFFVFLAHYFATYFSSINPKNFFIHTYSSLLLKLTGENRFGSVDYKSGFMYLKEDCVYFDNDFIKKGIIELQKFNDFCNKNKIKLYILITPQKSDIYPYNANLLKNTEFLQNELKKSGLRAIYPLDELKEGANKNYMFFKTEHHWTDDAAYISYNLLINSIQKDFPNIKPLSIYDFTLSYNYLIRGDWERSFRYGTTCHNIGLPLSECKKFHDTKYRYYTNKNVDDLKIENKDNKNTYINYYHFPNGAPYRAILMGSSQIENLAEFIPYSFSNTLKIRNKNETKTDKPFYKIMKYNKDLILDYKPDILILCLSYNHFKHLRDIFSP